MQNEMAFRKEYTETGVSLVLIQLIAFPDPTTEDRKTMILFLSAVPLPNPGRARR